MGKRDVARVVGLSLVLTSLVAGACAQGQNGAARPGASVTSSATPGPTRAGTLNPAPPTPTASRTKGTVSQMTLRGQVQEGVEAGCMILNADGGEVYLLLGGDRQIISAGGRVEVVGEPQPGLMTTCQQGTPFLVTHVRKI